VRNDLVDGSAVRSRARRPGLKARGNGKPIRPNGKRAIRMPDVWVGVDDKRFRRDYAEGRSPYFRDRRTVSIEDVRRDLPPPGEAFIARTSTEAVPELQGQLPVGTPSRLKIWDVVRKVRARERTKARDKHLGSLKDQGFERRMREFYRPTIMDADDKSVMINLASLQRFVLHDLQRDLVEAAFNYKYKESRGLEKYDVADKLQAYSKLVRGS